MKEQDVIMNDFPLADRVTRLRQLMAERSVEAFVLPVQEGANWESLYYLSGFRGSSGAAVITPGETFLVTDGRYRTQARGQSPFSLVEQEGSSLVLAVIGLLERLDTKRVGLEWERVTHDLFLAFDERGYAIEDVSSFLPRLRRRKDDEESSLIREAALKAGQAFLRTLEKTSEGMTEREFAALLEYEIRLCGAEGGWGTNEFIVASGQRSALPHGRATDRAFRRGDWFTVDFGARYGGYLSDITRNVSCGTPDGWLLEIHDLVRRAHDVAAELLAPGLPCREIDRAARSVIEAGGYGEHFSHGLGHGLGLEVHEAPRLSPRCDDCLCVGDVVTVEPGIYVEGRGGVRLENDYVITDGGSLCLTDRLESRLFEI